MVNEITKAEFGRLTAEQQANLAPILLTADGIPYAVIGKIGEVVILSDMHPRVRRNFKAMEEKIRMGMPKGRRIYEDEARAKPKTESDKLVEAIYGS